MDDENKDDDVIEFKPASELLKKEKEDEVDEKFSRISFEKYIATIPKAINKEEVLKAEKEWFEETVEKARWLEKAKINILNESDYQSINGQKFIKKTGVKKLANAFHISVKILQVSENIIDWGNQEQRSQKNVIISPAGKELIITVRARAERHLLLKDINTQRTIDVVVDTVEEVGACSSYELATKKGQSYNYHNILTTATTRATNRAIMNLLGGEVSAEEITYDDSVV